VGDLADPRAGVHGDPVFGEGGREDRAGFGLLGRQEPVRSLEHGDGDAEAGVTSASSAPIAPPPMTASEPGSVSAATASRLVQ